MKIKQRFLPPVYLSGFLGILFSMMAFFLILAGLLNGFNVFAFILAVIFIIIGVFFIVLIYM